MDGPIVMSEISQITLLTCGIKKNKINEQVELYKLIENIFTVAK